MKKKRGPSAVYLMSLLYYEVTIILHNKLQTVFLCGMDYVIVFQHRAQWTLLYMYILAIDQT